MLLIEWNVVEPSFLANTSNYWSKFKTFNSPFCVLLYHKKNQFIIPALINV